MEIEEEIEKMEVDKGINRLPSISILDDNYKTNYEEITAFQNHFDEQNKQYHNNNFKIDITSDYKKWLDKQYKQSILRPLTRNEYSNFMTSRHNAFVNQYVQPLWENFCNRNLNKVNEIKQSMQAFLQK